MNLSECLYHLEDLFILSLCFCASGTILFVPQPPKYQEIGVYVCGRDCCRRIPGEIQFEMEKKSAKLCDRIVFREVQEVVCVVCKAYARVC